MKKLYKKKGTVHPTPPLILDDQLSFLPATILTLTAALSIEDRQVLAYLLSCSSSNNHVTNQKKNMRKTTTTAAAAAAATQGGGDHPSSFNCCCFRCYMSYWVRWDASPKRQLIHEIIDAFEEGLSMQGKKDKSKRERRKRRSNRGSSELRRSELSKDELSESDSVEDSCATSISGCGQSSGGGEEEELEKGSVRTFFSFLGEKIWGVWN